MSGTFFHACASLQLVVEANPFQEISQPLRWRHLEVLVDDGQARLVEPRKVKREFQTAASDHVAKRLEARGHVTSLPPSDHRLGLTDPLPEFGLGQAGSKSGFPD
jgi:hypothetical protein